MKIKYHGIENRKKIRLRVYNATLNFAVLEIKQKKGDNYLKKSLKIDKIDAIEIINKNYSVLLKYNDEFAKEIYSIMTVEGYLPKNVIEYTRKAYVTEDNNTRITFDYNIKTSETNYNIFDAELNLNNSTITSNIILEVKYSNFLLTYIKDLLNIIDKNEIAFSKYCIGRNTTKYYEYM